MIMTEAGPAALIDAVRTLSRPFIFTTSLPPAIASGALESVRHLRASEAERTALTRNARLLLDRHGIYVQSIDSPDVPAGEELLRITPSPVHDPKDVENLAGLLAGIWEELDIVTASDRNAS
jgi:5-aminolevulinate synthase